MRRVSFESGEWYHCYNRGVDKRVIFRNSADYYRFQVLLYLSNGTSSFNVHDLVKYDGTWTFSSLLTTDRGASKVAIGAYALMPNHYHILLREVEEGGVTSFMRKLGTAYTMYFNAKNERSGVLFTGRFKAKHVDGDRYMRRLVNYIHANPAELHERKFKQGMIRNGAALKDFLYEYRYSSFIDYQELRNNRPEAEIINRTALKLATDVDLSFSRILDDARTFATPFN